MKIYRFRVWKENDCVLCEDDIYIQPKEKFEQRGLNEFLEMFKERDIVKILDEESNTILFFSTKKEPLIAEWTAIKKGIDLVQNFDNQFVFAEMN